MAKKKKPVGRPRGAETIPTGAKILKPLHSFCRKRKRNLNKDINEALTDFYIKVERAEQKAS